MWTHSPELCFSFCSLSLSASKLKSIHPSIPSAFNLPKSNLHLFLCDCRISVCFSFRSATDFTQLRSISTAQAIFIQILLFPIRYRFQSIPVSFNSASYIHANTPECKS